jgi:hypothetical protein
MNKFEAWKKLKFDVMFVGDDWYNTDKWREFEKQFDEVGVRIVYFPYSKGTSSTLINEILIAEKSKVRNPISMNDLRSIKRYPGALKVGYNTLF